jgi:hypothetical protein
MVNYLIPSKELLVIVKAVGLIVVLASMQNLVINIMTSVISNLKI